MSVKFDFTGRRVLITGAASGLGKAIAESFLAANATVFALDKDESKLKELKGCYPLLEIVHANLLDWDECKRKVDLLAPIHILINNAGFADGSPLGSIEEKDVDLIFGVNFKCMINLGQCVANGLKRCNVSGGTIVNVSSVLDTRVFPGAPLYSCTKAAITTLTKTMAVQFAPQGVRAVTLRPGLMDTPFHDKANNQEHFDLVEKASMDHQVTKRMVTVEECAKITLFLCSDAAVMINGSGVTVDGGFCTC